MESVDVFQRYKLPPVEITYTKLKGSDVTHITNLKDIIKFCNIPVITFAKNERNRINCTVLTKYLSSKIGTRVVTINEKTCVICGKHDGMSLLKHVHTFIKKYFYCLHCNTPEVCIRVCVSKKKRYPPGYVKKFCTSCGNNETISDDIGIFNSIM
uniref:ORF10 n=1 Tax=Malaco herpesvirus 2 TaxID=3031798 RepID=A0AA48P7E4_9VIRU|nr:TPA_asm: ORF10 [Malaco herpesvirus 2]